MLTVAQTTRNIWNFMVEKLSLQEIATSVIIQEISDSNLDTGRYGTKSGVSWIIWDSWQHWPSLPAVVVVVLQISRHARWLFLGWQLRDKVAVVAFCRVCMTKNRVQFQVGENAFNLRGKECLCKQWEADVQGITQHTRHKQFVGIYFTKGLFLMHQPVTLKPFLHNKSGCRELLRYHSNSGTFQIGNS